MSTLSRLPIGRVIAMPLLLLALATPALAQQPQAASREREALRRAQLALQQAQQQRDATLAEKATLQRALEQAQAGARGSSGRLAAQQRELAALRAQAEQLRAELEAARTSAEQAAAEARRRAEDSGIRSAQQINQLRAELAERTAANRALVARTEALTAELQRGEAARARLHAVGLEAVQAFESKGTATGVLQGEPLLGLAAVRVENRASELRERLDDARRGVPRAPAP